MDNNYTVLHLHSDLSSGVTNIDSVTKYHDYIEYAASLGMKAMAFSEHGSVFSWVKKKETLEKHGMKYIHASEVYVTKTLDEKIRDNKHLLLISKNYDGVLELNKMISKSFNRDDGHFYYVPRITLNELFATSDNIIILTACLGGILPEGDDEMRKAFLKFIVKNKHRCFLEIQHHAVEKQARYNKYLYDISKKYGMKLVATTDTHALNATHLEGRAILQKAKNIYFDNEEGWDLTFKTYDELVKAFEIQNALPKDVILEAINNTNIIADMVEEFDLDRSYKYPHLWENSEELFKEKIKQGIIAKGVHKYPNFQEYKDRIKYELQAYKHNQAIDFMLLMEDIITWCKQNDIQVGYGRGSCNGSVIAWLLGITEMDSIKYKLNFERFMNVERVSLSDIDTDFPPSRIEDVKNYIYQRKGLYCSDIITFNTIADKGAIRDVGRALNMDLSLVSEICDAVDNEEQYTKVRERYQELFKYVDIVKGTVVSIGTHPCGVLVSPFPLDDKIGLCTTKTDPHPVSQAYMKEVDSLNYVKLDCLKLDTIQIISDTCKLANIPMILPDSVDINDTKVWNSIRDDTTGIFQWEGSVGDSYIKKLLSNENIKRFKQVNEDVDRMTLLSIGNSAIRPAGASYRDDLANGIVRTTGSKPIDDFLKPTFGYLCFQCQIIDFLHLYCGFTMGEADVVRRGFAKKTGTEQFIPIIKNGGYLTEKSTHYIEGYIKTMKDKYGIEEYKSEEDIIAFIKVIEDASSYLFSLNHSTPYSFEGYVCGYLRYYYPAEFLTAAFNAASDKEEKTVALTTYASKNNINISLAKFRHSSSKYMCDASTRTIYKGLTSIKYMAENTANDLYELGKKQYNSFIELLVDIKNIACDSRQLDILIKLDFFSEFGNPNQLLAQVELFNKIYGKKQFKKDNLVAPEYIMKEFAGKETDKMYTQVDTVGLLSKLCETTTDIKTSLLERLAWQAELLSYINVTKKNWPENVHYVQEIDGNWITLYRMKDGYSFKIKTRAKYMKKNTFVQGQLIKVLQIDQENKFIKLEDGEWGRSEEKEDILKDWQIIKEG